MHRHAHWFIRLPFAATFLYHGLGKLFEPGAAAMMGVSTGPFVLAGIAEVLASVGAVVGGVPGAPRRALVSRLAGVAAAPVMLGAIVMFHWPQWSFVANELKPMGGMEFQVLLLGVATWFALGGGDPQA